ncbi:glutaminyl-peptide cyclotransferase [soil metagenome]
MPFKAVLAVLALAACAWPPAGQSATPVYGYEVVKTYPHDPNAFTEGLFYQDGVLYESTGLEGQSYIRKVRLETGEVLMQRNIDNKYFGEGIVAWHGKLVELTWQNQIGFTYDLATFQPTGEFHYPGEGWALTHDGKRIIMSDGTPQLRFLDPVTLKETGRLSVNDNGVPIPNLNELEWVKGEILANIWQGDRIARIDPVSGKVKGWIDLTGILKPTGPMARRPDVLNGIAYDAKADRLFVTGKFWPKIYEIMIVQPKPGG